MELLIRASSDRILDIGEKGLTLFTWLAALPVQGSYTLEVKGRKGKHTQHQALMRVRFGKTKIKQKNPHAKHTLGWLGWIVARLGGGWKDYASERKPGPITMLHGLRVLQNIRYGW